MSKNTNNFEVTKTKLSIDERGRLINRCVNSCFVGNEYHVEMLEPIFQISVMQMFTDKPVITTKATVDDEEVETLDYNATYEMIQDDNIMSEIESVIERKCVGYFEELHSDVIESLEFKKSQVLAQTTSLSDKVVGGIIEVLESIKSAVDSFDMSKSQEILDFVSKMNGTPQNQWSDSIVQNLPKKDENKAVPSPIED